MTLELFLKRLKGTEFQSTMLIKMKVNVLSLIVGHMSVLIVKTDIKVLLLNLFIILNMLKEKQKLILLILEKVLI